MKPICTINIFGDKEWYINGKLHRIANPAIECVSGYKEWYINGLFHREDGPAIEHINGDKYWFYKNKQIYCRDNKEFLRMIKLIAFL